MNANPALVGNDHSEMHYILHDDDVHFPLRSFKFSRTVLIAVTISIASLIFAGLLLYQVQAQSLAFQLSAGAVKDTSSGKVYLNAGAAAGAVSASAIKPARTLQFNIANNGLVTVQGARVVSISGEALRVEMKWSSADLTWDIQTNSNTKFFNSKGERQSFDNIRVGDILTVTGMLGQGGAEPTIMAEFVRE